MDRRSQLDEEDEDDKEDEEDDEDEEEAAGGRRRRKDDEAGGRQEEEATDIKSNNPHLAGGEKHGNCCSDSQGVDNHVDLFFLSMNHTASLHCHDPCAYDPWLVPQTNPVAEMYLIDLFQFGATKNTCHVTMFRFRSHFTPKNEPSFDTHIWISDLALHSTAWFKTS